MELQRPAQRTKKKPARRRVPEIPDIVPADPHAPEADHGRLLAAAEAHARASSQGLGGGDQDMWHDHLVWDDRPRDASAAMRSRRQSSASGAADDYPGPAAVAAALSDNLLVSAGVGAGVSVGRDAHASAALTPAASPPQGSIPGGWEWESADAPQESPQEVAAHSPARQHHAIHAMPTMPAAPTTPTMPTIVHDYADTTALWNDLRRNNESMLSARLPLASLYPETLATLPTAPAATPSDLVDPWATTAPAEDVAPTAPPPAADAVIGPEMPQEPSAPPATPSAPQLDMPVDPALYPSAPAMLPEPASGAAAPGMLSSSELLDNPFAHEVARPKLQASAPSLDDIAAMTSAGIATPAAAAAAVAASVALTTTTTTDPLPDAVWDAMLQGAVDEQHAALVTEFRGRINHLDLGDPFYEKVLLYETAFKNAGRIHSQLHALRLSAKNLSGRLWSLSRVPKTASAVCSDGRQVTHTYTDEDAVVNAKVEADLVSAWSQARVLFNVHLSKALFETKMSKIWIQNSLDSFMARHFQAALQAMQASPFAFIEGWEALSHVDQDVSQLLHYLDVLFAFERHNHSRGASRSGQALSTTTAPSATPLRPLVAPTASSMDASPNGTNVAASAAGTQSASSQALHEEQSAFTKDVRAWIAFIVAVVIRCGGPVAHRHILLHVLRCPGIGSWGAHFVQWPLPQRWTEAWATQYVVALRALLGPIEELEEAEAHRVSEMAFVRANLKRLEVEDEWVVVDEQLFIPSAPRSVVCLSEDDYIRLFRQFNLPAVFENLIFHCIAEHTSALHRKSAASDKLQGPSSFVFLFAFANRVLGLIGRSFDALPSSYRSLLRLMCETLAAMSATLAAHTLPDTRGQPDASASTPMHIFVSHPHHARSTVRAESEAFVLRLVRLLLAHGSIGAWDCLLVLPLEILSRSTRRAIFLAAISGSSFAREGSGSQTHPLSLVLLSNPGRAQTLLRFLVELLRQDRAAALTSGSLDTPVHPLTPTTPTTAAEAAELAADVCKLVRIIFENCLLQLDVQASLVDAATAALVSLCDQFPAALSTALQIAWSDFSKLEAVSEMIFMQLPLAKWPVDVPDMEILQSMLNDPIGSPRFRFVLSILQRMGWSSIESTGTMLIPQRHQRTLAIHIAHRLLDRQSSREAQATLVSATSAATIATVEKVSKQVLPFQVPTLFADADKEFEQWCWRLLPRLQIYQMPTSLNIYAVSAYDRPYESLDSPSIAALFAHAETSPLAAYVVALVSEIGHQHRQFETRGWKLLANILAKGPPAAFLHAAYLLMHNFVAGMGMEYLECTDFVRLFKGVYRTKIVVDEAGLRDPSSELAVLIMSLMRRAASSDSPDLDAQFAAQFWLRTVLVDKDWQHSITGLAVLDALCETFVKAGRHTMLHGALIAEYHSMLALYHTNQSNSFKFSYTRPVESIYSLATTIEHLATAYPTLIPQPAATPSISGAIGQLLTTERRHWAWLTFEALVVESLSERDAVRRVGRALSKDSRQTVQNVLSTPTSSQDTRAAEKPLESFSIFRWATAILQLPPQHPAMPLFFQGFFSLFLERFDAGSWTSPVFGHRFLAAHGQLVQRLSALLGQLISRIEVSSAATNVELTRLYRAMLLWIKESKMWSNPDSVAADDAFQIDRLHECSIFDESTSARLWLWLVADPPSATSDRVSSTSAPERRGSAVSPPAFAPPAASGAVATPAAGAQQDKRGGLSMAPAAPPPISFRPPAIPPIETLTIKAVADVFERDLKVVLDSARASQACAQRLEQLHTQCLENLRQLYSLNRRRVHVERTCSSRCAGQAIVQCDLQEATMNVDLRNLANDNAQQAELILSTDYVDARLCLSGLRLIGATDWLAHYSQLAVSDAGRSKPDSAASIAALLDRVFFSAARSLGQATPFAPAVFLADSLVRQLGGCVVDLPNEPTQRIFKLIESRESIDLFARVFDPCRVPDRFAEFYGALAKVLDGKDIPTVFAAFDLARWVGASDPQPTLLARQRLFETILAACEMHPGVRTFRAHLVQLVDLDSRGDLWVDCVPTAVKSALSGKLGLDAFGDLVARLLCEPEPRTQEPASPARVRNSPAGSPRSRLKSKQHARSAAVDFDRFVESSATSRDVFDRETLQRLITSLSRLFESAIDASLVREMSVERAALVLQLVVRLACAPALVAMRSDTEFAECQKALLALTMPWMMLSASFDGVTQEAPQSRLKARHQWTTDQAEYVATVVSMHSKGCAKICAVFSRPHVLPEIVWSFYADLVDARVSAVLLEALQHLALQLSWEAFQPSTQMLERMNQWIEQGLLTSGTAAFFVDVVQRSSQRTWRADDRVLWRVVLDLVHRIDTIWQDDTERLVAFKTIDRAFISQREPRWVSSALYAELVEQVPLEWPRPASTTLFDEDAPAPALSMCLWTLQQLAGFDDPRRLVARANLHAYVGFVSRLIERQIKAEQLLPVLRVITPSFAPESLAGVVTETLQIAEVTATATAASNRLEEAEPLLDTIQSVISLLNLCQRDSKLFPQLWDGLQQAVRATQNAMAFLSAGCRSMSSLEHMALMAESSIRWHMERRASPHEWDVVVDVLQVPDLEESAFVRHCLSHALVLTLHGLCRKRLSRGRGIADLKIMMGEQLGVWIESVRVENVEQGQESSKILLLLLLFGELLSFELGALTLPEGHSRLRAHLPLISDALFRWSEDRSGRGIWATLGFGPQSRLPVEFRFVARFLAVFIALRLVDADAEEQRAKLMESFAKMRQGAEYQPLAGDADEAARLLGDPACGLAQLHGVVDLFARRLFPAWASLALPMPA
nr:hypothetical protein HK105_003672 [Polyrhizophydium stewartii]